MLALLLAMWPDPWAETHDLDVLVISRGEAVAIDDHLVAGKFTLIDIGAAWCGPCHDAAREIKLYASIHDDVAVRVVALPGDPVESSQSPAFQLLPARPAVPYFEVYDPEGEQIYSGHRVTRALRRIERNRD